MAGEKQSTNAQERLPQTLDELKHTRTIDTIHQDEALRVLAQYAGDETWTPEEEKRLVRKIDKKLISLLVVTYGLQYYDKAMLSQAVSYDNQNLTIPQLMFLGSLWITDRSPPERWQPLLLFGVDILPRIHCRKLPSHPHGAALAN
jgi:hypothetical protein